MALSASILAPLRLIARLVLITVQLICVIGFAYTAYAIRLYSIEDYGMIIHEFDPWFNYRATEYLAEHGLSKFFKWYDYMSWYPLGRPIGTTIYPGMQMAGVAIWETMKLIPKMSFEVPNGLRSLVVVLRGLGFTMLPKLPKVFSYAPMSVNDICCMMPPWFAVPASLFTGLIAYEATRSTNAAVLAVGIMAVIPAHLMRSVGGEFDNEAVAMAAICATFWLWLRSVRTPKSWPWGILAGVSYIYMVAAWGGYIFVINMIGVHALMLVGLGRFNSGVHKAYTLFFAIGTAGAIQIPVVGMQPLRSLEQMGPLLVFLGYQVLAFCDMQRRSQEMSAKVFRFYRIKVSIFCLALLVIAAAMLWPTGYFGPLSARIRGLFVKHTKTGNPLVDSVAEHQPASSGIYSTYLNLALDYVPLGIIVLLFNRSNAGYFVALYGFIAEHFSHKMSRLVLICAPICSIFCAIGIGFVIDFLLEPFLLILGKPGFKDTSYLSSSEKKGSEAKGKPNKSKKKLAASTSAAESNGLAEWDEEYRPAGMAAIKRTLKAEILQNIPEEYLSTYDSKRRLFDGTFNVLLARAAFSLLFIFVVTTLSGIPHKVNTFLDHCHHVARSLANPKVVFLVNHQGQRIKIDDYYRGYLWIDKNTAKDARVMAWWDYGYQITGIARRTSIADGNTWNHEHIATLGRTLTSPEKKAWNVIRHLADYVLVWAGGRGDDLAKSPHLARIGNSVFPEHCGDDDPKCIKFGFNQDGTPKKMMADCLLFKAVQHNLKPGVKLNKNLFKEVHTTEHGLMRVFKVLNVSEESKAWVADPQNRKCDAPGSWFCPGQYPPALDKLIAKRRNFAQVEDFNKAGSKSAYTKMIERERAGKSADL